MTSRSYFGKMNSALGSVVPLAMFIIVYNTVAYDHLKSNACAHLKRLEYHHLEAGTGAVSGDLFLSH